MKITVIGPGRWGSCIAWYLGTIGHDVTLYGQKGTDSIEEFLHTRKNSFLTLPENVAVTDSMDCIPLAETIVVSIPTQALQGLFDELKPLKLKNKNFVLCMKGIEIGTNRRLSQIAEDNLDKSNTVSVWIGPGHVQEFTKGNPSCMVIDSKNDEIKHYLADSFSSDLIRFSYGTDLIGNEIGAASKNVIGIAAGMLDGLGLCSLKGPLMARAPREIALLIKALGGKEISAYGLCHLGDYEATVFSEHSHNRKFGEDIVKGVKFDKLAEGYYTVIPLLTLAKQHGVDLPICSSVYEVLYNGCDAKVALLKLFNRDRKKEF